MSTIRKRLPQDQILHNMLKTIRTTTRLAYSLAAGNKLNELEDDLRKQYAAHLQSASKSTSEAEIKKQFLRSIQHLLDEALMAVQQRVRNEQDRAERLALKS